MRRGHRRGLTLFELLAATALAAMLLAALAGVLNNIVAQRRVLQSVITVEPWQTEMLEQLRWDFANARRMRVSPERITLLGYGGRDFSTGQPTHRPTQVDYYISEAGSQPWLLRREAHLDDLTNENQRTEVVCAGVALLQVRRLRQRETGRTERPKVRLRGVPPPLQDVPDQLQLILWSADESAPPLVTQEFLLR